MPVLALILNISWEFTYSFIYPFDGYKLYLNIIWLSFDVIILYQFVKYGGIQRFFPMKAELASIVFGLAMAASCSYVLMVHIEFDDQRGKLTAYTINLIMSLAFNIRIMRSNYSGQSVYIAFFKMVGTAVPSVLFYRKNPESPVLNFLYLSVFILDGIYTFMIQKKLRNAGINWSMRA